MKRNPIDELAAGVMLFTRLPLGRVWRQLPTECFNHGVTWWPAIGWLTAGVTAGVFLLLSSATGAMVAAVAALAVRIMLTGGLHEDGLADVADGLGGRVDRERALAIMKDSQIGSYGVLALTLYCLMFVATTTSTTTTMAAAMILCADPWGRYCAGRLVAFLPYARPEGAKNGLSYPRPGVADRLTALFFGGAPMVVFTIATGEAFAVIAAVAAVIAVGVLIGWYRHRLGGYTGDCCGATYLICETVFMLTFIALQSWNLPL
jgi:adenosylcobinamide-GDP ribazoletransferase